MELEFVGAEESENISAMAFPLYREVYTFVSHDVLEDFLAKNQTPEHIREQMDAGMRYTYILIRGDRAGYVCFCPRDGSMFLSKLYLLADHRGHGVGSGVIAYLEDIALKEGLSSISLDVQGTTWVRSTSTRSWVSRSPVPWAPVASAWRSPWVCANLYKQRPVRRGYRCSNG